MAGDSNQNGQMMATINITPFVDIVLVLLVVLMVSSVQIVKASMEVNLPKAASAGQAVESTLNIVIKKDGSMLVNGRSASEDQLIATVKKERKANPKVQAVIAADKDVIYERVVRAIDIVKTNGVKSFALNIERMTIK